MKLAIFSVSADRISEAKNHFSSEYLWSLKNKPFFNESLCGRLKISEMIWWNYLPEEKGEIPYFYDENFWSLSHKEGLVFCATDVNSIWIDIEILKERDESLFATFSDMDYKMLGWKNWKNFYILWTAHESMQKYDQEKEYCKDAYNFIEIHEVQNATCWIEFERELVFWKWAKTYTIFSGAEEEIIYSVSRKWKSTERS